MSFRLLLAICLLVGTCGRAPLFAQQAAATPADYAAVLDQAFPADGPGATAIVVKDGKTVYHAGHGMASLELDVKMQPDHVLRIGSITKQFTAMAVLKLMEAGQLSLDDPLSKFLPDYPNGDNITVTQLLNHTSGIRSYTGMEKWNDETRRRDFTVAELVDFFKDEPADFAPGEQWAYNNSGYILLGAIIEEVTGEGYAAYLEKTFFGPLGMDQTYYDYTLKIIPKRVPGYTPGILGQQNTPYLSMTQPYAAGSLLSTVGDLSKWYHSLADGKVVRPETFKLAISPAIMNDGNTRDYGFGLFFGEDGESSYFGHAGGVNGFVTDSRYYPEDKLFVAVFTNSNNNSPTEPMLMLAQLALGKVDMAQATRVFSPQQIAALSGDYELAEGFIITIRENNGRLEAQATGQGAFLLDATAEDDVFTKTAYGIKIVFKRDATGKVTGLTLDQGGERNAPKIK